MHRFFQSLIGCSRSVERAAHRPQTRQMGVFDHSQCENSVCCGRCRSHAPEPSIFFPPLCTVLTQRKLSSAYSFSRCPQPRQRRRCSSSIENLKCVAFFCAYSRRTSDAGPDARAQKIVYIF